MIRKILLGVLLCLGLFACNKQEKEAEQGYIPGPQAYFVIYDSEGNNVMLHDQCSYNVHLVVYNGETFPCDFTHGRIYDVFHYCDSDRSEIQGCRVHYWFIEVMTAKFGDVVDFTAIYGENEWNVRLITSAEGGENRVDEVLVDGVKAEGVQLKERLTAFPLYMK